MAAKVSEQILKDAWIGDAVLALHARCRILAQDGVIDGAKAARMSSNQFLSSYAEPSHTEAEIGRVYEVSGLEAAFAWIDAHLTPLFDRQEAKRLNGTGRRQAVVPLRRDLPE
jgi:dsRNA-specific ribonuclease